MTVIGVARQRLGMEHELAARGAGIVGDDRGLDADLWTTPALQVEFDGSVGAGCARSLSGFDLRFSLRAIMDIRAFPSSITRRPRPAMEFEPSSQKHRWDRSSICLFRLANLGGMLMSDLGCYAAFPIMVAL